MHGEYQHLLNLYFITFCLALQYYLCGPCLTIFYIWVPSVSQVDSIAAEETQAVKKTLDTSEPVGVLGWEVLEAEGTVTEKLAENSMSSNEEETPGLVKAMMGVFHKG